MAATLLLGRCNPYGAETGGPRHVMGGLHGPASAASPPEMMPGLPENVAQGEWSCPYPAEIRVRMTCRCGHTGKVMDLCSWHDESYSHGEMIAGTIRRATSTRRVHGHYEEIQRRQAGACIRCLFPGQYAEWYKSLQMRQEELALLRDSGQWYSTRANHVRTAIQDICSQFDQGNSDGTIHRCPMKLIPVS